MSQIAYRVGELGSGLTDLEVCKRVARYAKSSVFNVMIELIEAMSEAASLVSTKLWDIGCPLETTGHSEKLTDQNRVESWRGVRGGASP